MASGVMQTGNFPTALDKRFHKVFFDNYMRQPEQFSKLAHVESHTEGSRKEGRLISLGSMEAKPEGRSINYESFLEGPSKTMSYTVYAKGLQITEEMLDDDLTGHMSKGFAELGKSAAYTKELKYWDILNSGFGTTRVGADAVALFSASHPEYGAGAGTQSNLAADALSYASLQAAINKFDTMANDRGIPIADSPTVLIIPPALRWKAQELIKSELKPGAETNDINTLKGEGLQFMVCNYLTSNTAWFLASPKHDLRFMWRKKLAFGKQDDHNTGNRLYKASMRFTTDFVDWRGIVGSTGL